MTILPIVEGHGEVLAVPELIRRICFDIQYFSVEVLRGYRVNRSKLASPEMLPNIVEAAYIQYKPDAILILFDADDDCPKQLYETLYPVCLAAPTKSCLVAANREYEAWFLGAIESLKLNGSLLAEAEAHLEPEGPRDAKRQLNNRMNEPYSETLHQRKFTASFSLEEAHQNCRSFRKLRSSLALLLQDLEAT